LEVAREVAEFLDIPFFTFDFVAEYEKKVLNYIFEWYARWLTPNPDVFCNTWIKFDLFLEEALSYGYDAVATGHYARILSHVRLDNTINDNTINWWHNQSESWIIELSNYPLSLLRGIDSEKDQSYFLSALSRKQLSHTLFPIGHLHKSEVREIARKIWLPNAERKDSQGLCFVGKVDFSQFLKSSIPPKLWYIVDTQGNRIGEHDGAFQYTIGQRKGIGVGWWPALYVLEKDVLTNTVIVGEEDDERLYRSSCRITNLNWLVDVADELECEAQIRYRQKAQKCFLQMKNEEEEYLNGIPSRMKNDGLSSDFGSISVIFDEPQRAITPGQVCAFYDGERVLGSWIIVQ
jgi:tRNA-uridine 2-sulfurtransferase